ncbi:hypothetical protein PanWU01x14_283700 [Parasponia andersonii]|uniref:Uncharacterized protein n=1 Tax=Parasponia andersonii TaxID=3476 RepID=A0A2P5B067_PARAD|nr:hypothetical protein PanWU01x14_283700 [Parasponia andersonii]
MEDRLLIREFCTFTHDAIEEMVNDSCQGCYAATEMLFHNGGHISVDSEFVANIYGLCEYKSNPLF